MSLGLVQSPRALPYPIPILCIITIVPLQCRGWYPSCAPCYLTLSFSFLICQTGLVTMPALQVCFRSEVLRSVPSLQ
jgi:hypothetical protein